MRISTAQGNLIPTLPQGAAPTALWPGYADTQSVDLGVWPPNTVTNWTTGAPDHYVIYRDGVKYFGSSGPASVPWSSSNNTGVVPNPQVSGGGAHASIWYVDRGLAPGETHQYAVTAVDASGNESAAAGPIVLTALTNGSSVPPTAPVSADSWIQPDTFPTGTVWTVTQTTIANYNLAGTGVNNATGCGLGYALANSNINGGDAIVIASAAAVTIPAAGMVIPAYTGTNGFTRITTDQDPLYTGAKLLPSFSLSNTNFGLGVLQLSAPPAANSTSATLAPNQTGITNSSGQWLLTGGYYYVIFSDGEERLCNFARNSATMSWSDSNNYNGFYAQVGLTNSVSATVQIAAELGSGGTHNYANPSFIPFAMSTVLFGTGAGIAVSIPQACNKVRFVGINFQQITGQALGTAIQFANNNTGSPTFVMPDSIYFDRCIVGDNITRASYSKLTHGMDVTCNHFLVHQCYFWGITNATGGDSQAIFVRGGQYHSIQNSYLSAVSESFIYGGVYVAQNSIPQDIVVRYNMSHKPLMWGPNSTQYLAFFTNLKNLAEFKVGIRAELFGNLMLNCWTQPGPNGVSGYHGVAFSINCRDQTLFSATNFTGTNPWNVVTDINIHDNQVYNCQSAFSCFSADAITSYDARLRFANNLCWISTIVSTSDFMNGIRIGAGPTADVIIDHNTIICNNTLNTSGVGTAQGFYFPNFGAASGSYGNPNPYTPSPWTNLPDRLTVTNNVIDSGATLGNAFHFDVSLSFAAMKNLTFTNNVTVSDPQVYATANVIASNVGYNGLGFTVAPVNTAIPLHPTDWNVTTGQFATASTTGGPLGAIFGGTQPATATKVNWAPGHYFQFGNNDTQASRTSFISTLPPGVGVFDAWTWGHMDTNATAPANPTNPSNYNFSDPLAVLSACHAAGRPYMFLCLTRTFSGSGAPGQPSPPWIQTNGWTYQRTGGSNNVGGAALWVAGCMQAKTNIEIAFYNAAVAAGTASSLVAVGGDESTFGSGNTLGSGASPFSYSQYVINENTRWSTFRTAVPPVGIFTNLNFDDINGVNPPFTTMQGIFQNAVNIGGVFLCVGPDALQHNVYTSSATPAQQVLDGRGGPGYVGSLYGVIGSVQANDPSSVTAQAVFDEHNNHFQAQYIIWNRNPWGNGVSPSPTLAQLLAFVGSNPVTNTAYPQSWPGATQPSFTQTFSFPNFTGFTNGNPINIVSSGGTGIFTGGKIQLTTGTHQNGAAWYITKVNVQQFRTDFTFQMPPGQIVPACKGISFVIQNSDAGTNPASMPGNGVGITGIGDANLAGYGAYWWTTGFNFQLGVGNSVAVTFDMSNSNGTSNSAGNGNQGTTTYNPLTSQRPNSVGLFTQTGPSSSFLPKCDLTPTGVDMYNGNVMACSMVYDGAVLTMTLQDTVTLATAKMSWAVPIPTIVGGNTAWLGFTGGQAGSNASGQLLINSWSHNGIAASGGSLQRLNTPLFNLAPMQYTASQNVSITGPAGATICYTTNGQAPSSSSTVYNGTPISIMNSTLLQAVAIQSGRTDSQIAAAYYQISASAVPNINFPNFTGSGPLLSLVGCSAITGSSLFLTPHVQIAQSPQVGYVAAAWFVVPQSVGSFSTQFVFQMQAGIGGQAQACGLTFCMQNQPPSSAFKFNDAIPASTDGVLRYSAGGPLAIATGAGFGYSGNTGTSQAEPVGLTKSVAVKFDATPGGAPCFTGVYTNGAQVVGNVGANVSATGLDFTTGHQFQVNIDYNNATTSFGNIIKIVIKDLSTSTSFTVPNVVLDIAGTVGSVAYIGFTAGTNVGNSQQINSWTFSS